MGLESPLLRSMLTQTLRLGQQWLIDPPPSHGQFSHASELARFAVFRPLTSVECLFSMTFLRGAGAVGGVVGAQCGEAGARYGGLYRRDERGLGGKGVGVHRGGAQAESRPDHGAEPGRAVQVDPIEPTLKAPGVKCLTLKCDEPH